MIATPRRTSDLGGQNPAYRPTWATDEAAKRPRPGRLPLYRCPGRARSGSVALWSMGRHRSFWHNSHESPGCGVLWCRCRVTRPRGRYLLRALRAPPPAAKAASVAGERG